MADISEYIISTDNDLLDVEKIHRMLSTFSWCKQIPIEYIKRMIKYSYCFGVYYHEEQVGFARIVTDYTTFAYFCDGFIVPEHRKKGLFKWLFETMMADPKIQGLKTYCLNPAEETKFLYLRAGFEPTQNPELYCFKEDLEIYTRDEFENLYK